MAENFKEMLEEQKKTNQLLVKMNEDPSLASSIKQNLGEILNASRLANRDEEYQKKEGVTEVDEEVEKVEKAIGDLHDDTVESFNALQSVISDGQIPASSLEEGKNISVEVPPKPLTLNQRLKLTFIAPASDYVILSNGQKYTLGELVEEIKIIEINFKSREVKLEDNTSFTY